MPAVVKVVNCVLSNSEIKNWLQCNLGRGNSVMVSVSVCEAGRPGSSTARSICISQIGGDLQACYQLVPTSAEDWFNKGGPCVIMSM